MEADRGNTTGFVFRSGQTTVPPGTRTVRLEQTATRASGGTTYNNAYSDKINIQFRDSNAYIGSSSISIPFDNDSTVSGGGVHLQHGTLNLASGGLNSNTGSFAVDDEGPSSFAGLETFCLDGLDAEAARELLEERACAEVAPEVARRITRAAGGNSRSRTGSPWTGRSGFRSPGKRRRGRSSHIPHRGSRRARR